MLHIVVVYVLNINKHKDKQKLIFNLASLAVVMLLQNPRFCKKVISQACCAYVVLVISY